MKITDSINGIEISCETGNYYFSPESFDKGTLQMLRIVGTEPKTSETVGAYSVSVSEHDKVLDLGCGYGVVGIYVSKLIGGDHVVMSDVSDEAVALSADNLRNNGIQGTTVLKSEGLKNIPDRDFTLILSNPPYHTDFSVAKGFIEEGFRRLVVGGRIVMVTKRLEWYKNKIAAVFGGVRVYESEGYYVFVGEKRQAHVERKKDKPAGAGNMSKKLRRKEERKKHGI